jgi:hypothetical protein
VRLQLELLVGFVTETGRVRDVQPALIIERDRDGPIHHRRSGDEFDGKTFRHRKRLSGEFELRTFRVRTVQRGRERAGAARQQESRTGERGAKQPAVWFHAMPPLHRTF